MNELSVNLISNQTANKKLFFRIVLRWAVAWIVVLCILVSISKSKWDKGLASKNKLSDLESQQQQLDGNIQLIRKFKKRIKEIEVQQETLQGLADRKPLLTLMATIANASKIKNGESLAVNELQLEPFPATPNRYRLNISGVSTNHQNVAGFAKNLRESKRFATVELQTLGTTLVNDVSASQFTIECQY